MMMAMILTRQLGMNFPKVWAFFSLRQTLGLGVILVCLQQRGLS